jgi:muconolactone delta-isomerase
MSQFLIEHTWKKERTNEVVAVVGKIGAMAKGGELPKGFTLKSIHAVAGETQAFCLWEAPDRAGLQGLLAQVHPPTQVTIYELNRMA